MKDIFLPTVHKHGVTECHVEDATANAHRKDMTAEDMNEIDIKVSALCFTSYGQASYKTIYSEVRLLFN